MNVFALLQALVALVSSLFGKRGDSKEVEAFKSATQKAKDEKDPTSLDDSF